MKNIEKESYINTFLIIDQFASNSLSEKKVFSMMKRSAPEMFDSDDWTQLMVNHLAMATQFINCKQRA